MKRRRRESIIILLTTLFISLNLYGQGKLYENIMGESFVKADVSNIQERIEANVNLFLKNYN